MSTPEITSVSFNIKSPDGSPRSYDLSKKTLVVGPNGIGKSAVVQAVALAISGAAEEVAGRAITSDPALLMSLAHQHGHDGSVVFARVNLSNGEHCQWETKRDEGRIKTPIHIRPRWIIPHTSKEHSPHFPLREVREVLTGSAKKARERFLTWVCSDLDDDVVLAALGADVDMFSELTVGCDDMAPVDKLMQAVSAADKQARKLRSDAKAQTSLRDKLLSEVGAKPRGEAVLAARDAVKEAQALHEENLREAGASGVADKRKLLHDLLGKLRADEQRLLAEIVVADTNIRNLEQSETLEYKGSAGAAHALAWALDEDADGCPICSSPVGNAHLRACHDFYADKVKGLGAQTKKLQELRSSRQRDKEALSGTRAQILRHESDLEGLPAAVDSRSAVSVDDTRTALAQAQAKLEALNESATKWHQLTAAKNLVDTNYALAEKFSNFKRLSQKAVAKLLEDRVDGFCQRVSGYLPDGWEFGVMVTDSGRDVFYYGLLAGDEDTRYLRVGLSEAQRVSVLVAMCAVLDEMLPTPLSVLAPEDRGWDPSTLGSMMQALREVPQMVMLTSTVMPAKEDHAGWTVINLGGAPPPAKARMVAPSLPPQAAPEAVQVTPSLPELPEALRERYDASSGRARGGKFRSLKRHVALFITENGVEMTLQVLRLAHPVLVVEDGTSPDDLATTVANYLVPLGPQ